MLISHHLTFYVITALLKHFVNVKRKTTLIFSCLRKIARVYVLSTASCELRTETIGLQSHTAAFKMLIYERFFKHSLEIFRFEVSNLQFHEINQYV